MLYFLASSGSYRSCAAAMGMSKALVDEFAQLRDVQCVVGTIDGPLIAIERPANYEGFYCRKGYAAINVQAVVSAWQRFMCIDEDEAVEDGFQHIKKAIPDEVTDALLASAAAVDGWYTIFREGDEQDDYRLKAEVPPGNVLDTVTALMLSVARGYNEDWATAKLEDEELPGIVLVALEDDMELATYGWINCHPLKDVENIVELQKGDMLICRGDLVNCGMKYEKVNVRLHCYLDIESEGSSYVTNQTQLCRFASFARKQCYEDFDSENDRRAHQWSCTVY
ncbi:hypothetical protein PybrP1_007055 [[Pythium] brassicae (nom. inval.)]|nr:hypothetical protein PybrP1_007055 [[Pythium] brassicae (nom. inval.)]